MKTPNRLLGGRTPRAVISPDTSICAAIDGGAPVSMSTPTSHAGIPGTWQSTISVTGRRACRPRTVTRSTSYSSRGPVVFAFGASANSARSSWRGTTSLDPILVAGTPRMPASVRAGALHQPAGQRNAS